MQPTQEMIAAANLVTQSSAVLSARGYLKMEVTIEGNEDNTNDKL